MTNIGFVQVNIFLLACYALHPLQNMKVNETQSSSFAAQIHENNFMHGINTFYVHISYFFEIINTYMQRIAKKFKVNNEYFQNIFLQKKIKLKCDKTKLSAYSAL